MFSMASTSLAGRGRPTHPLWARRTLASIVALATGVAIPLIAAPPAHAGPDQDKGVFTRQHVDAPVPAWNRGAKRLSILANSTPAHDSVLYLGRGWRGSQPKHVFKNSSGDPRLEFLGEASRVWLSAPQDPGTGNTPIWAGIGVDPSLSGNADDFENGSYALDIVDVRGPGRVESFIHTPWRVNRVFSSENLAHRTVWNPRHMHAYTLFSKPGRYEVNVAAVGRDADGSVVYSSPITPVVWQVGGADPRHGTIKDYGDAYNKARPQRTDGKTQGGQLTIAPKKKFVTAGDDVLTDFTFTTGNVVDQGHLVVLIDGFYLTEVPVTNGQASFDEMIGDDESDFQAIYIPTDPVSARIATTPVSFSRISEGTVTSEGAATSLATPEPADSPVMLPDSHVVESGTVNITFTPLPGDDPDKYTIEAHGDPSLDAEIIMSWHEKPDRNPACSYERQLTRGSSTGIGDILGYCKANAKYMLVTINPHPYANVKPTNYEITDWDLGEDGRTFTFELPLREHEDDLTPAPRIPRWEATAYDPTTAVTQPAPSTPLPEAPAPHTPQPPTSEVPTPPAAGNGDQTQSGTTPGGSTGGPTVTPPSTPPSTDHPAALLTNPIRIHKGHLDIRLNPAGADKWIMAVKDDSMIDANSSVLRKPEAVTIVVAANAKMKRAGAFAAPAFDFLGPVGTVNYVLSQAEEPAKPWPGFSTEDVDYSKYPQGVDYALTVRSAPDKGRMLFVTASDLGENVDIHIDSHDPQRNRIHTEGATHLHGNWVFTQAGNYVVDIEALSGTQTLARGTITFDVDSLNSLSSHTPNSSDNNSTPDHNSTDHSRAGDSTPGATTPSGGRSDTPNPGSTGGAPTPKGSDHSARQPDASQGHTNNRGAGNRGTENPSAGNPGTAGHRSTNHGGGSTTLAGGAPTTQISNTPLVTPPSGQPTPANTAARRAGQAAMNNSTPSSLPQRRGILGLLGLANGTETPQSGEQPQSGAHAQSGASAVAGAQSGTQSGGLPLARPMSADELRDAQSAAQSEEARTAAKGNPQSRAAFALPNNRDMVLGVGALLAGAVVAAGIGIYGMRKGK